MALHSGTGQASSGSNGIKESTERWQAFMPGVYAGISTTPRSHVPNFGALLIQETHLGIWAFFKKFGDSFHNFILYMVDNHWGTMIAVWVQEKVVLEAPWF
ncbi:hypothetical protein [Dyadobacter aurulentus]|uniref:hypothetical protein n=1 Tax=Dyadobacter sp. UC 10 TaxID=2605428 RepID=UPI0011F174BB|nr:hypothetical protein [Dyadobacter sp. UC 10]KAA0993408.1 hypothetical protein FXO21_26130 [Dyadobacter sp. UC 10]